MQNYFFNLGKNSTLQLKGIFIQFFFWVAVVVCLKLNKFLERNSCDKIIPLFCIIFWMKSFKISSSSSLIYFFDQAKGFFFYLWEFYESTDRTFSLISSLIFNRFFLPFPDDIRWARKKKCSHLERIDITTKCRVYLSAFYTL